MRISIKLGVESSARDALNRAFYTAVVSDVVSLADKDTHILSLKHGEIVTVKSSNEHISSTGRLWSCFKI